MTCYNIFLAGSKSLKWLAKDGVICQNLYYHIILAIGCQIFLLRLPAKTARILMTENVPSAQSAAI